MMDSLAYEVKISDIQTTFQPVRLECRSTPAQVFDFEIRVRDDSLAGLGSGQIPSILADLVDLATAVHTADRVCANKANRVRNIDLVMSVRNLSCVESERIRRQIEECLFHFTHDHWSMRFVERKGYPRISELQYRHDFNATIKQPSEIALWSGGLDSLVGFLNRAHDFPEKQFTLLGATSNPNVLSQQLRLFRLTRRITNIDAGLVQVSLDRRGLDGKKNLNSELRARGFVFLLLGMVTAILQGQALLHVYENGVGAFSLPFSAAEVGLDHTRAVHPLSLHKMGQLVSELVGSTVSIENPFTYVTKGEMCKVLHAFDEHIMLELICATTAV